ncbi:D-alanyl-D-alanine carboxypeptidase/D-alanyl-D-alanine endopeptidase [Bacillus marasmi]|uniref:D-alanyl-D-alanine carboxypeptidase/D-alanyl-D-alanine endopeptidase n=1 Tax=Bacillus marasmi TaxID=1926279 RepID=UPI0011CCDC00|nr:D-alanyl-D-alanine carboxypeptidase/D-alanyl-D-alanine-endopeptidase [Bacillus marasmi]
MQYFLHKRCLFVVIIAFFVFGMSTSNHFVAAEMNPPLVEKMMQYIEQDPALQGSIVGISLRSPKDGEIIFQHNGDVRLKPASNLKLLTAAAALKVLGENYRFTTNLLMNGTVKKENLKGDLILQGKGDPTLLKEDFDMLASKVKEAGIEVISGDLIGDDSWYDDVRYSLDLPWSDEETYYGAQISALTASPDKDYDAGTVMIEVKPGKSIGDNADISLTPNTKYINIINEAVTVSPDGEQKLSFRREHGTNLVKISGTIPLKSKSKREWIGVWDPTLYALELFKQSLENKGIKVIGNTKKGSAPETAHPVYSHQSIPLSELIIPFMKLSNNGHAEILVKEMGKVKKAEGSWEKGLAVMEEALQTMGLNTDTFVLRDGSGISHADLIPANEITKLLFLIQKEQWFSVFHHSLPVSGDDTKEVGGTLRRRMKDQKLSGRIIAKTGTIATVSSLSGYAEQKNGEKIIFAILLNNLIDEEKGKQIEDRLITMLVE